MTPDDHAEILDKLAEGNQRRLIDIMRELEERIASLVISAPTEDGKLFDLAWALQARADIAQAMRETYLTGVDEIVGGYTEISDSLTDLLSQYKSFSGVPPEVIAQLQQATFLGFEDVANEYANQLGNELYQYTLAGRPIDESVKNVRQTLNGVYMQSDQDEINRLVGLADSGDEEAVRILHTKYASDRTGNNMRRYANQMMHDSVMQFNGSLTVATGKEAGVEKWEYYGSTVKDSRQFCRDHVGESYTEEEIRRIWDSRSWQGKAPGDPFIVRGGYNCRHHWLPDFED